MIVGCDIDSVLNNLVTVWVSRLNHRYNINPYIKLSDITEWSMKKAFFMLTDEQITQPLIEDDLWEKLVPLPDSQTYLKIINDQHKLYLITSTDYRNLKVKMKWLQKYFPFIKPEQVIVAHNKQLINVDVLIDDYEQNLLGANYDGILFNYPWNMNFDAEKYEITRVNNWTDIFDTIQLLDFIKRKQCVS